MLHMRKTQPLLSPAGSHAVKRLVNPPSALSCVSGPCLTQTEQVESEPPPAVPCAVSVFLRGIQMPHRIFPLRLHGDIHPILLLMGEGREQ